MIGSAEVITIALATEADDPVVEGVHNPSGLQMEETAELFQGQSRFAKPSELVDHHAEYFCQRMSKELGETTLAAVRSRHGRYHSQEAVAISHAICSEGRGDGHAEEDGGSRCM